MQKYEDVIKEAKNAFRNVKRTESEKRTARKNMKPFKKMVGFVDGMREILVYRCEFDMMEKKR